MNKLGFMKIKAYLCALVFLVALSPIAKADYLYAGGWSKHTDMEGITNERHDLIAYQRGDWIGGRFINSYGDETAVLARSFGLVQRENFSVSAVAGTTYGYDNCVTGVLCPYGALGVFYSKHRVQPGLLFSGNVTLFTVRFAL